jgi:amidase
VGEENTLLNGFGINSLLAQLHAGEVSCERVTSRYLERIKRREDEVQAWTYLDEARALDEARSRDRSPNRGPLFGIPVGVKDIINTVDMPSEYGSPIYRGHRPCADAACVALLRAAGAAVLGKTITTEFATTYRGKTRNPHALNRTPGGSFVSIRRSF